MRRRMPGPVHKKMGNRREKAEREQFMFKALRKYGIFLAMLGGIVLQIWLLGGHFPWVSSNTHQASPLSRGIAARAERRKRVYPISMRRPDFQTGVIFPQWGTTAYSQEDANWQTGLDDIQEQTAARWVSLTIDLAQLSPQATQVLTAQNTPTPQAVGAGIRVARAMGYHVFVQPLITIAGQHTWAGYIQFATAQAAQSWFDSYWHTFEPYAATAAQAGAEELAIGTEYELMQRAWPAQWNQLLARTHTVFSGMLTYGMNWTSLTYPIPSWMHNPLLTSIGVSMYIPLINIPERLQPKAIPGLWREKIGKVLDTLSVELNKPVLISEIGYRDSPDALFNPWQAQTLAGTDPEEQAAAYDAALQNVIVDQHIIGIFFWAWSFPSYQPNGKLASRVLYRWYTSPLA